MDSVKLTGSYSVPNEGFKVLRAGIFDNFKISKHIPADLVDIENRINITGSALPAIPVNWRFAESAAALRHSRDV